MFSHKSIPVLQIFSTNSGYFCSICFLLLKLHFVIKGRDAFDQVTNTFQSDDEGKILNLIKPTSSLFLASLDTLEVMLVTESVSKGTDRDFTDVTLVSSPFR